MCQYMFVCFSFVCVLLKNKNKHVFQKLKKNDQIMTKLIVKYVNLLFIYPVCMIFMARAIIVNKDMYNNQVHCIIYCIQLYVFRCVLCCVLCDAFSLLSTLFSCSNTSHWQLSHFSSLIKSRYFWQKWVFESWCHNHSTIGATPTEKQKINITLHCESKDVLVVRIWSCLYDRWCMRHHNILINALLFW